MPGQKWIDKNWELISAILIALVSFVTAFTVYLTTNAGSIASESNRQGMIEAIKLETFSNENWRKTYQEASSAFSYALASAEIQVLKNAADPNQKSRLDNYEKYLIPNLKQMAAPLVENQRYFKPDGTIDLQARFSDLQNTPEINALDPKKFFNMAEIAYAEQRWLLIGSILLAFSLFWLTVSQIISHRRMPSFYTGCFFFLVGILWVIIYLLQTGGAS